MKVEDRINEMKSDRREIKRMKGSVKDMIFEMKQNTTNETTEIANHKNEIIEWRINHTKKEIEWMEDNI